MTNGGARTFHLGAVAQRIWGPSPSGVQGEAPVVIQKLKQFADIVYRVWL